MRVLEIALANPETASFGSRVRAERVIQACVGLSPSRRAQAANFGSSKQRDVTADPKIRLAACWLALELGSADLPAWAESCKYLADPVDQNDRSLRLANSGVVINRFDEFVTFAANRSDPLQRTELNIDPLIAILEKSKRRFAHMEADHGFARSHTLTALSGGLTAL